MAELTQLGRYKLTKVLGRGAMGVVYEGLDPRLNRRVAIKTILKNAAIDEETSRMYSAQFAREAQAAGRLNHPNIVHVHDFAEEGEIAYLVMEYIQGRELRSYFDAGEKFTLAEAVRVMGELLDALHFAHEAGIIHRDVKPANVMLDAEKRVKLADFGVARIQDSERSAAGTMVGTPAFMSPEQISGGKIDRRTDVFSAGVVLYQLLTGDQPFTGAGAWTVAKKIMQDDPPQPSSVVKSVSPAFDAIVLKALAKKPGERYASAREFATDLRAALGGGQPSATASMPPAAAPRTGPAAQASEAEVEFWKAIQNSTDAAEFEFYLEQFPEGTYAALARHKIARLNAQAAPSAQDTARLEAEAAARQRREAEAQAQREAAEAAKREAEEKARREAQEKAKREAEEARRAAQARAEAEARAKKVAEELAQRQAAALARLKKDEEARKAAAPDPEATVAMARPARPARAAAPAEPVERKNKSFLVPALIVAALAVAGAGAFVALNRKPAPAPEPVAQAPRPEVTAAEIEKIRKETEERVRKEYADKSSAEQAAAAKAAAEKAVQEKQAAAEKAAAEKAAAGKALASKAAADKAALDKANAEKAAAEKAGLAKAASEKAAAEKAAAEKAQAEKAAADKLAAEKAAAEKAAADKLAAEKAVAAKAAAARKPGWPAVGDRWVYEAKDSQRPENRYTFSVEAKAVGPGGVSDTTTRPNGSAVDVAHGSGVRLVGVAQGIVNVNPYLNVFQSLGAGKSWSNVEFRQLFRCGSAFSCTASGSVAGRERVSVKAGSFDAVKVVFTVYSTNATGGSAVIELRYWFAEAVARIVKYELRTNNPNFSQPLMDYELASYTPAGS